MEEKNSVRTFSAELSKRGLVSLWETGGGYSNSGDAQIICKADGSMPTAIYMPRGGHLACGAHALIPVHSGYVIICSSHRRGDFEHRLYKVVSMSAETKEVKAELINEFSQGEWTSPLPQNLEVAVEAAEEKATTYHCRSAVYAVAKEKK